MLKTQILMHHIDEGSSKQGWSPGCQEGNRTTTMIQKE